MRWLLLIVLFGCTPRRVPDTEKLTTAYYKIYQQRKDFPQFMAYYDDNVVLEDMINGDRVEGKEALARFFNWDLPGYQLQDSVALKVTDMIVDDNRAVVSGYFTPFNWDTLHIGAMHFTTSLQWSDDGKIIKQVDWINYTDILLTNRKDANHWIK